MKTDFDLCEASHPLRNELTLQRQTNEFWDLLQRCDSRVKLGPPATENELAKLREYAGGTLPDCLEAFLRRSNGLRFDYDDIVFSVEQIIEETEMIRNLDDDGCHMPLDHLLFIGGTGDGDAFAFGKRVSGEWTTGVYQWEHETDSRYVVGLGTFGYVAAHVAWWHHVARK